MMARGNDVNVTEVAVDDRFHSSVVRNSASAYMTHFECHGSFSQGEERKLQQDCVCVHELGRRMCRAQSLNNMGHCWALPLAAH